MDTQKRLRDFIYLDVERLYSLYSQVFEGVADEIVQSYATALSSESAQKGALLSGSSIESSTIEISRRTENRFLYDHMYTLLETKLKAAIHDGSSLSLSNVGLLSSGVFLRITGPVLIADFSRMRSLLEQFNRLGEAIAYSRFTSERSAVANNAEEALKTIQNRDQRAQAKARLEQLRNPKQLAKQYGLAQDEQLLKNLILISDMFYPEGFDVTVLSSDPALAYRAVADKRWLRISAPMLRAQYGASSIGPWTVVGQITHVPGVAPAFDSGPSPAGGPSESEPNPSLRDPFMAMFNASLALERMFLESKMRAEIVLCPIAIYREVTLEPERS